MSTCSSDFYRSLSSSWAVVWHADLTALISDALPPKESECRQILWLRGLKRFPASSSSSTSLQKTLKEAWL
ncbi:hypothetical protein INR49_002031 [Caranx melampygus]|nr:hypothetical protein INR49_002031 [Caranx melampygus]